MSFDLAFFAAMVPAVILMGLAKGGFAGLGLLSLPLMSLVVPPLQAAAIMLPLLMAGDVVTVWSYRRDVDLHILATLLPGALLGILLAYLLAARVSDAAVQMALGAICVVFAIRRLLEGRGEAGPARKAGYGRGTLWGMVAGITSMIAHAGGPPFQIYAMPQRLTPAVFVGTGTVFFATLNALKVVPYLALGQFAPESLVASAILAPVSVLATIAGIWLVRRIAPARFYRLICWLLLAIGAKLAIGGAREVIWGT